LDNNFGNSNYAQSVAIRVRRMDEPNVQNLDIKTCVCFQASTNRTLIAYDLCKWHPNKCIGIFVDFPKKSVIK
jgi:hypothetical protein